MKSKKLVSIILAVAFFICAAAFAAVSVYILTLGQDFPTLLFGSIVFDLVLIPTLLCLAAGVVLILSAGKRTMPVAIALCSGGVLFMSIPNLFYFIFAIVQADGGEIPLFVTGIIAASALAIVGGIVASVFASKWYRFQVKAAAPVAEVVAEEPAEVVAPEEPAEPAVSEEQQ